MIARAALLLSACALARAQHHDPFAGSGCDCTRFCAGECAIFPSPPQNITLYRMTPLNVDAVTDKNTGDARGDTSYVMGRRTSAYDCAHLTDPSRAWSCATLIVAGDDPHSTDLVIAFTVEVDGQWGPYLYCNPNDAKHPDEAWTCATHITSGGGGQPPADYPAQCTAANFTGADKYCYVNTPSKTVSGVDLAGCCAAAQQGGSSRYSRHAYGYTYFASNQTCLLFDSMRNTARSCDEGVTGHWEQSSGSSGSSTCDCPKVHASVGRENLTSMSSGGSYGGSSLYVAGGEWYSTPREGQCKPGQAVGSGCSWRSVGMSKAVNTTCMYDRIDAAIVKRDPSCFSKCPKASPGTSWEYDRTSSCYSQCFSAVVKGMTGEEMAEPWDVAFGSEEQTDGGCPSVPLPAAH